MRRVPVVFIIALLPLACSNPLRSSGSEPVPPPKAVAETNRGLKLRTSPLAVGKPVPTFELTDQAGRAVSSGELVSGSGAVLIFLPPVGNPAARPGFEWANKNRQLLSQRGLEVLLVAPDPVAVNATAARTEGLRVALLSDPASWVAQAFGVVPKGSKAPARPWAAVVGGDGRLQFLRAGLPDASELIMAAESRPGAPRGSVTDFL